jgi:hypothetical protein
VIKAMEDSGLKEALIDDAKEQLVDERMAYERNPKAGEYQDFKRMTLGISMQEGGWHHTERALVSAAANSLVEQSRGDIPLAHFSVRRRATQEEMARVQVGGDFTLGRVKGNDLVLAAGNVSKRHTRVVAKDGRHLVVDLKTTNGTYLNGKRINGPQALKAGDRIDVGGFSLTYEAVAKSSTASE